MHLTNKVFKAGLCQVDHARGVQLLLKWTFLLHLLSVHLVYCVALSLHVVYLASLGRFDLSNLAFYIIVTNV